MTHTFALIVDCYDVFTGQVSDKQARLDDTLTFQQKYQEALQNVSSWLDDIETKLFMTDLDSDIDQQLRDTEVSYYCLCSVEMYRN